MVQSWGAVDRTWDYSGLGSSVYVASNIYLSMGQMR